MQVRHRLFLLVLATVVLPFVIKLADFFLLIFARDHDWPVPTSVAVFGWLVVQTGMICYFAGRWLPNWGWRLGFLGWWLLLSNRAYWGPHPIHIAFSSAQIGALAFWMFLGTATWWRRLAILSLAVVPVFLWGEAGRNLLGWQGDTSVRIIVLMQTVAICILASALNAGGYRIEPAVFGESQSGPGPIQFSIRHLLIATMMVAVMVPIVQEMLNVPSLSLSGRQRLHASFNGLVLAVVSLAAMWAALGAGRWWIRGLVFSLLAVGAGLGLSWLEETVWHTPPYYAPAPGIHLTEAGWWWVAWTLLAGSLMAGLLMVLRATGYQLVRRRRYKSGIQATT